MENLATLDRRVTVLETEGSRMRKDLYGTEGDDVGLVREFRTQQDMRAGESLAARRLITVFGVINTLLLIIIALRQLKVM